MEGLAPFILFKVVLGGVLPIAWGLRELWLLNHGRDDPEFTRRLVHVLGRRRPRPAAATVPAEPALPEPVRRAA
jgi:hypothetical protein